MKHTDALRVSQGKGIALCCITASGKAVDVLLRYYTGKLVDSGTGQAVFLTALPVIAAICVCNLVLQYLAPYAENRFEASYTGTLFSRLDEKILFSRQEQIDRRNIGEFSTCLSSDISGLLQYVRRMLLFLFPDIISFTICIGLIIAMHPALGAVALISGMISAFFMTKLSAGMVKGLNIYQDKLKNINKLTSDSLANLEMVKVNGMEKDLAKWYGEELNQLHKMRERVALRQAVLSAPTVTLSFITLLTIVFCGGYFVMTDRMSVGQLLSAAALSDYIVSPVMRLENSLVQYRRAAVHLRNFSLFENMEREEKTVFGIRAAAECSVRSLCFQYPDGEKVFDGTEFEFEKGKINYIVGQNGSGKSTFLKIIGGIYEIDSGEICLPIKSDGRDAIRAAVSVMPQESLVFSDSIKENLLAGACRDEEKMYRMCETFGLHDEIRNMENGYDTILKEQGASLSGGQKKRIAFIRSILREAAVYIFDEPTVNVDRENAVRMMEYISGLTERHYVIMITHDRDMMEKYPGTVYVLNGGRANEK